MPNPDDTRRSNAAGQPSAIALDIVQEAGSWTGFGAIELLIEAAGAAVAQSKSLGRMGACEACVALSDDAGVRKLNSAYRAKDKPTNVLSFPASRARGAPHGGPRLLGDIVLAEQTVLNEATEMDIDPRHHLQHLVVHGLLHLLGYDHATNEEAGAMEALEIEILAGLGIPNPYTDAAGRPLPIELQRSIP